ncbi:MAG: RNA polymerase sigma-70 factor [Niabella sp.]
MDLKDINKLCADIAENNDERALSLLFKHFAPGLLVYIKSIVHNASAAEELVGDVFIGMWKHRDILPSIRNLRYYLYTSAKNCALNYLRDNKKDIFTNVSLSDMGEEHSLFTYIIPESPEENIQAALVKAVSMLPYKCQLIFRLSKEEHLTRTEIAQLLNISVKTVENQMTIAYKKLHDSLRNVVPKTYQREHSVKFSKNVLGG